MSARRTAADRDARDGDSRRLRERWEMRDHRVDVRKHVRERVRASQLVVAEHVVHRCDHEPLFGHLGEQLGAASRLAAAPPRAAVHKEVERRGPVDLADVPGQVEVVRLRDALMRGALAHLPPAIRQVLAHMRPRALGNLRGREPKRRRVRVSGECVDDHERQREKYDMTCCFFHGGLPC